MAFQYAYPDPGSTAYPLSSASSHLRIWRFRPHAKLDKCHTCPLTLFYLNAGCPWLDAQDQKVCSTHLIYAFAVLSALIVVNRDCSRIAAMPTTTQAISGRSKDCAVTLCVAAGLTARRAEFVAMYLQPCRTVVSWILQVRHPAENEDPWEMWCFKAGPVATPSNTNR